MAARQLRDLYQAGLLDKPFRNTEAYRRRARPANRDIQLASATPWIDLGNHIPSTEDGVDYARETLERFHEWTVTLRPEDAQAEIEKASTGRQTLDWLLDTDHKTRFACGTDYRLLKLLAHFIVAEGEEEHLWGWIRKEFHALNPLSDPLARTRREDWYSWIGRFLGEVAEVHLARNPESADKALQVMVDLRALKRDRPSARAINIGALHVCLGNALIAGRHRETSAALFDRYLEVRHDPGLKGRLSKLEYQTALCLFLHPRRPDPDPLLAHFQSLESKPRERLFNPKSAREAYFTRKICQRLAEMLEKKSRNKDAEWARNFSKRFEVIWHRLAVRDSPRGNRNASRGRPRRDDEPETSPSDLLRMRKRR